MKKTISWGLVILWIFTLGLLMMGKGMLAMYLMVIGMLVDSLKCIFLNK
ncbi:hypothetical protein R4B61_01935 [Fructilactobacillus vespulae]